jgi:hypothetical protein
MKYIYTLTILILLNFNGNTQAINDSFPFVLSSKKTLKLLPRIPNKNINIDISKINWSNKFGDVSFITNDKEDVLFVYDKASDSLLINNKRIEMKFLKVLYKDDVFYCLENEMTLTENERFVINSWTKEKCNIRKHNIKYALTTFENTFQNISIYDSVIIFRTPTKTTRLFSELPSYVSSSSQSDKINSSGSQNSGKDANTLNINGSSIIYMFNVIIDTLNPKSKMIAINYNDENYFCYEDDLGLSYKEKLIINSWTNKCLNLRMYKVTQTKVNLKEAEFLESKLQIDREKKKRIADSIANIEIIKERKRKNIAAKKQISEAIANGLVFMWSWNEEELYSLKSQGFKFDVINTTQKKIKYIYITVSIYNPVNDFISKKTVTIVGPLDKNGEGTAEFNNLFHSNVAETAKINSVKVLYFDGSSKLYSGSSLYKIIIEKNMYKDYINQGNDLEE